VQKGVALVVRQRRTTLDNNCQVSFGNVGQTGKVDKRVDMNREVDIGLTGVAEDRVDATPVC